MERNDLISVIIPIYNVERYLVKCIESVLKQTYSNLEIILIDDGSEDKCGKICEEYKKKDNRIKVIHKTNEGLSEARNAGIVNATGKYITFVDSDDYIDDCYIELLYNVLISYSADISIASHRIIYKNRCIDKSTNEEFCANSKLILEKILYDDGIDLSTWGKLYKIELFDNIRFPKGRLFEDSATTYKLIDISKNIAVYSKAVYNYIMRNDSISKSKFSEKKLDLITSTKEMTDFIRSKYPCLSNACNRRLMYAYLSTLTQLAQCKETNKQIEKELLEYIRENKQKVLKDKRIPKRDRLGIYASIFGLRFYKLALNFYSNISKRS